MPSQKRQQHVPQPADLLTYDQPALAMFLGQQEGVALFPFGPDLAGKRADQAGPVPVHFFRPDAAKLAAQSVSVVAGVEGVRREANLVQDTDVGVWRKRARNQKALPPELLTIGAHEALQTGGAGILRADMQDTMW